MTFTRSTQKEHWMFESPDRIRDSREKAIHKYLSKFSAVEDEPEKAGLLSVDEEVQLCQLVTDTAMKFCKVFEPSMPAAVIWTGFSYFKRFYLKSSAMEFMPKNTMMGCLYLACKEWRKISRFVWVRDDTHITRQILKHDLSEFSSKKKIEEFNVSVDEFVRNLKSGTPQGNRDTVLNLEAIIMEKMDFHLTIHGPFRPLEGHLIDLKTNYGTLTDPERLRSESQKFLYRGLFGDAPLLYPPSQISLAALFYAARNIEESLEPYIRDVLVSEDPEKADRLISRLEEIIMTVNSGDPPAPEIAGNLQERARQCVQVIAELEEKRAKTGKKKRSITASQSDRDGKKARRNSGDQG